jgi:hypothetical protein
MGTEVKGLSGRSAVVIAAACLLAAVCSCSSHTGAAAGGTVESPRAQQAPAGVDAEPAGDSAAELTLTLTNFTGSAIRGVYVSPSDSNGWEENVLAGGELADGDSLKIAFDPDARNVLWDIRVEDGSEHKHYAEWKGINLREVSKIALHLSPVGKAVAVAE